MNTDALKVFVSFLLFSFLFNCAGLVQAQDQSSSDFEQFKDHFQKEYFSVGALLQTVGDYQFERTGDGNGFSVGNARLQVYGEFDQKFGYQLQANFLNRTSLLDANMYYHFTPEFGVKAGLFKAPFSYEYLTGAAAIDFVNRSSVVNQLAPKRQIGLQFQGKVSDGRFSYRAGMFNGNGLGANVNDDNNFLYTARVQTNSSIGGLSDSKFTMGLNASYEQSEGGTSGAGALPQVQGEQLLLGADSRISYNGMMVAGEFIYSTIDSDFGTQFNPYGFYVTGGYFVTPKTQLLARWDYFNGDFLIPSSESVLGGVNFFPSDFSEVQLNYIYPIDRGADFSQILLNLQINF